VGCKQFPTSPNRGFVANNLLYCKRRFDFTREMSAGLLTTFGLVTVCTQSLGLRLLQHYLTEPQIVRLYFSSPSPNPDLLPLPTGH
jgi:hypothetical protein